MKHKKAYGCIPIRGEKGAREVLLVRNHEKNTWGFPKGAKEEGESDIETALRELYEETGLALCDIIEGVSFEDSYHAEWKGTPYFKEVFLYLCHGAPNHIPKPEPSTEIAEAAWFPFLTARAHITYEAQKRILERVAEYLDEPLVSA